MIDTLLLDNTGSRLLSCNPNAEGTIVIPDSILEIESNAFEGCINVTGIIMSDNVIKIGHSAFKDCDNLYFVTLSNKVEHLEFELFSYCRRLHIINLPLSLKTIEAAAFEMCSNLNTLHFPKGLEYIGKGSFIGSGLKDVVLPLGLYKIDDDGFCNCHELVSCVLPNSVLELGHSCFRGCEKLQNTEIPNGVKTIDNGAFGGCDSITEFYIPSSVEKIGRGAFCGQNVENIYVSKNNPNYKSVDGILFDKGMSVLHTYPRNKKLLSYTIPISTRIIMSDAFAGSIHLRNIIFNENISEIGESSFSNSGIETLELPNSISKIPFQAFRYCKSLKKLSLGKDTENIADWAFCDCSSLVEIHIPSSIRYIGKSAFCFCYSLERIYIPEAKVKICEGAFGWSHVKEIHLGVEDPTIFVDDFIDYIHPENCTLYIPFGTKYAYQNHPLFKDFKTILYESI